MVDFVVENILSSQVIECSLYLQKTNKVISYGGLLESFNHVKIKRHIQRVVILFIFIFLFAYLQLENGIF